MGWDKEGKRVSGLYMNQTPVVGLVTVSLVTYSGRVSHLVQLDEAVVVYGTTRDMVILYEDEVLSSV